ncbi:hypothetical protein N9112_00240 [bacterium]|nr:hypothetical protein [bacterium]
MIDVSKMVPPGAKKANPYVTEDDSFGKAKTTTEGVKTNGVEKKTPYVSEEKGFTPREPSRGKPKSTTYTQQAAVRCATRSLPEHDSDSPLIIIIDGDVLAYEACRGEWQRIVIRLKQAFGKDAYKKALMEHTLTEELITRCWATFEAKLLEIQERFFNAPYVMAMKDGINFRDDVYIDYKAYRKTKGVPNRIVPFMRDMAVEAGYSIPADYREADDYVRTWATEAVAFGKVPIVASVDKDLKCIPGKHYNLQKQTLEDVAEIDAKKLYYSQLLSGDQTDGIPGLPGIGPVKGYEAIEFCVTEEDFQEAVVGTYLDIHGDDWAEYLLSNGKLIHIMADLNDYFTLKDWPVAQELR